MEAPTPVDVLLVEDNPADVYLVQRAVADCGPAIRLTAMFGGREALGLLRKEPPFVNKPSPILIIVDLSLPRYDGHDLIWEIRGLPEYRRTPVVVLSASERAVEEARCLALEANAYVQKSSKFTDYFGSIKGIVQHWLGSFCAPLQGRGAREHRRPEGKREGESYARKRSPLLPKRKRTTQLQGSLLFSAYKSLPHGSIEVRGPKEPYMGVHSVFPCLCSR